MTREESNRIILECAAARLGSYPVKVCTDIFMGVSHEVTRCLINHGAMVERRYRSQPNKADTIIVTARLDTTYGTVSASYSETPTEKELVQFLKTDASKIIKIGEEFLLTLE